MDAKRKQGQQNALSAMEKEKFDDLVTGWYTTVLKATGSIIEQGRGMFFQKSKLRNYDEFTMVVEDETTITHIRKSSIT